MEVEAGPQALEILRTLMSEKKSTSREKYSIPCFVGLAIIKRVWVIVALLFIPMRYFIPSNLRFRSSDVSESHGCRE